MYNIYEILLAKLIFFALGDIVYQAFGIPKSRSAAQTFCKKTNTSLASFVNQNNIESILDTITLINGNGSLYFWTGLKYTKSNCTWSFIDGADTTFAILKVILPKPVHNDQCVVIRGDGQLFGEDCAEGRQFVCQQGELPIDSPKAISTG